jgi:transmembrane sensor
MLTPAAIDPALLHEAADWAMRLHYDAPSEADRRAFEHWRGQSPAHYAAWARAQSVFHTFGQVPPDIGRETLRRMEHDRGRRRSLRLLAALPAAALGALAGYHAPWRQWTADVATATGERKTLSLPDGSRLVLNTASAVDIVFDANARRLRLVAGEILVTTQADSLRRPFLVDTAQGLVRALGTRFAVRQLENGLFRVVVFEHAVEVVPLAGAARTLRAGEQAEFGAAGVQPPAPIGDAAALWEKGMLLAKDMRLAEVIAELARHRPGVLRCDPAVAGLRVSGAISLADTDAALAMLAASLPLFIEYRTRYWVVVRGSEDRGSEDRGSEDRRQRTERARCALCSLWSVASRAGFASSDS